MKQTFVIQGSFLSLNEFYRLSRFEQARIKKDADELVGWSAKASHIRPCRGRIKYHVHWVEHNHKRDLDNVAFAKKFIQDGLVKAGIIKNDTHHEIAGFSDSFAYDPQDPRIEITLEEI